MMVVGIINLLLLRECEEIWIHFQGRPSSCVYRFPFRFAVDASYVNGHTVHIVKCMTGNAPFLVESTED